MRIVPFLLASALSFSLLTGCESSTGADPVPEDPIDLSEAQPAQETYEEIPFTLINWKEGEPERQPHGGVWVYTKEKHPAMFEDTLDWNNKDMLLVQIKDESYMGKGLKIKALQKIRPKVTRILVEFDEEGGKAGKAPRRYAEIPKGSIGPQNQFVIQTVDGKTIQ
jgi:hypothetical protein